MPALFPGSFDPPHLGHLDLIRRAAAQVDRLIVAVAVNPDKTQFLSTAERVAVLQTLCADLPNVRVDSYHGATVTYARAQGVRVLVRGLRSASDLDAEHPSAEINRANGVDTLFLLSRPEHVLISSRTIRMALAAGLPVTSMVPAAVAERLP
jgi:pantetheine-phosphate adenylyltransferase